MKVILNRSDFRESQDYPNESLFECVLADLKIPEKKWGMVDSVELEVVDFDEY